MTTFLDSIGYGGWILHVLLLLPTLGAVAVALVPSGAIRRTALAVSGLTFLLSLGLWWGVDTTTGTLQLTSSVPWLARWAAGCSPASSGST